MPLRASCYDIFGPRAADETTKRALGLRIERFNPQPEGHFCHSAVQPRLIFPKARLSALKEWALFGRVLVAGTAGVACIAGVLAARVVAAAGITGLIGAV